MLGKFGFVIGGTVLAMFVMGPAQSLVSHRGFSGPVAWAQSWDDQADDVAGDSKPPTVPDVSGSYSGTLEDHRLGPGNISVDITQKGAKLSGTWNSSFSGPNTHHFSGKVKSNSVVKLNLHFRGCTVATVGTFMNGDEISGTYKVLNCGRPDHGTFDILD